MDKNYSKGLSEKEVIKSRKEYGSNSINNMQKNSFLKLLISSLGDPIIKILLIALAVKTIVLFKSFDWYETIGIILAIILASFISSISEYGSEKAFDKLQEESARIRCLVRRDNKTVDIPIDDVVVNDMVVLASGDKIPADGILIQGELVVDESSLTGEAKEVYKDTENSKLFRGSVIYAKAGLMQVTSVGENTFYGRISKEVTEKAPDSPLKLRLRHLAKIISRIGYIGALFGALSYLFSVIILKNDFDLFLISATVTNISVMSNYFIYAITVAITIIIVSVPEGLPMMITLVLSSNMKRMLKSNVLVRKLVGIETAGSLNVLCFDKTGTITKGKPEVIGFLDSKLDFYKSKEKIKKFNYFDILKLSLIINNESAYDDKFNIVGGNITDKAILKFLKPEKINNIRILNFLPFDSKNKYAKTCINYNRRELTLIKGAPELILPYCINYYEKDGSKKLLLSKKKINDEIYKHVNNGIRVLAIATSFHDVIDHKFKELCLLGFILIKDEIRNDSRETIRKIKKAGIKTIMITGDNLKTAESIAKETLVLENPQDIILSSDEFNSYSDNHIREIFPDLKVVARAFPTDKSRLIKIAQSLNLVVGMTGDGVNDAPALKKADVGFAMGSGTEVAKEASDIVILDDNIKSISKAILFGRTIFKSIRKFIIFQLSLNICALLVSIIAPIFGIETPVTVMQMLWINMIMDTLAAFAFSYEPPLEEYMEEVPKPKNESILNKYMQSQILLAGLYSALVSILFLKLPFFKNFFRIVNTDHYFLTAFFSLFIFMGIFNSFNARTFRLNLLANIFKNKVFLATFMLIIIIQIILIYYGGDLFRTYGLSMKEFYLMIIISFSIIPIDFMRKIVLRLKGEKGGV